MRRRRVFLQRVVVEVLVAVAERHAEQLGARARLRHLVSMRIFVSLLPMPAAMRRELRVASERRAHGVEVVDVVAPAVDVVVLDLRAVADEDLDRAADERWRAAVRSIPSRPRWTQLAARLGDDERAREQRRAIALRRERASRRGDVDLDAVAARRGTRRRTRARRSARGTSTHRRRDVVVEMLSHDVLVLARGGAAGPRRSTPAGSWPTSSRCRARAACKRVERDRADVRAAPLLVARVREVHRLVQAPRVERASRAATPARPRAIARHQRA